MLASTFRRLAQEAIDEAVSITHDLIDTVMEEYNQWLESPEAAQPQATEGSSY